jgi:hypothetical protein
VDNIIRVVKFHLRPSSSCWEAWNCSSQRPCREQCMAYTFRSKSMLTYPISSSSIFQYFFSVGCNSLYLEDDTGPWVTLHFLPPSEEFMESCADGVVSPCCGLILSIHRHGWKPGLDSFDHARENPIQWLTRLMDEGCCRRSCRSMVLV